MTKEFLAGEQAERARSTAWLARRAQGFENLALRQRAINEPASERNAAYARALRYALSFLTEGEQTTQPTAVR